MKYLVKNKAWDIVEEYNCDKLLYLLIDRPTAVNFSGDFFWLNSKVHWHRNYDLPAVVYDYGIIIWYKNNDKHRTESKPAYIWYNGIKEYREYNKYIKTEYPK